MSDNTVFSKLTSINFTVRNKLSTQTVTIFGFTLYPGDSKDLLNIPEVSESDIRHSLIKGDLAIKLRNGALEVVSSSIDLMQFDPEQQQFLIDLGIQPYGVKPEAIVEIGDALYLKLDPIEDADAPNGSVYIAEDGQLSFKDENGEFGPVGSGEGGNPFEYIQYTEQDGGDVPGSSLYVSTDGELFFKTFEGQSERIHPVNSQLVLDALDNNVDRDVEFNFQTLRELKQPNATSTRTGDAVPVGWSRAQFLRTLDVEVISEDHQLERAFWRAVCQTDPLNWYYVTLPENPEVGDVVLFSVESEASCLSVIIPNSSESLYSSGYKGKYTYAGDGVWNVNNLNDSEWIAELFKHVYEACNITASTAIIIPDEGILNGIYNGNVICQGSCVVDSTVVINGNFYCVGSVVNSNRFDFTVNGDMIVGSSVNFNPWEGDLTYQGNLRVKGNLSAQDIYMQVKLIDGDTPTIYVGGNLYVSGNLYAWGQSGASGTNVDVGGNAFVGWVEIKGGDTLAQENGHAGNGGNFTVGGDFYTNQFVATGGASTSDFVGLNAGYAGTLTVDGNILQGSFFLNGGASEYGDGTNATGSAGSAGAIDCKGNAKVTAINASGGNCGSSDPNCTSGNGGYIQIGGDLFVANSGSIQLSGGLRWGTLSSSGEGSVDLPNGGELGVKGDLYASDASIYINGGAIGTVNFAPSDAGSAGSITVGGNLYHKNIEAMGGENTIAGGGAGGFINVGGDMISYGSFDSGVLFASGGNGGTVEDNTVTIGFGGNAGQVDVRGNIINFSGGISGGNGYQGSAANGGSITTGGYLSISADNVYLNGGNSVSTDANHNAGSGGEITAKCGIYSYGSINMSGGEKSGVTTETGDATSPNGGSIIIEKGNLYCLSILMFGGNSTSDYKSSDGGTGGQIQVNGNIICPGDIYLSGGISNGGNGGLGGTFFCSGYVNARSIVTNGGNAAVAIGDSAQGYAGSPYGIQMIGGCNVTTIEMLDGSTGQAPGSVVFLHLGGNCNISTINVTDRSEVVIRPFNQDTIVHLTTTSMLDKDTLNDHADQLTPQVTNPKQKMFVFNNSAWYVFEGAAFTV